MNIKLFFTIILAMVPFSLYSQWGIAYNEGWGNKDLKSYPNFSHQLIMSETV